MGSLALQEQLRCKNNCAARTAELQEQLRCKNSAGELCASAREMTNIHRHHHGSRRLLHERLNHDIRIQKTKSAGYTDPFTQRSEVAMAQYVWIFNAANSRFPGGVFSGLESAESWIAENKLTGVLTEYPLDIGVWEWAVKNQFFTHRGTENPSPEWIGGFTTASQNHFHYEAGDRA